MVDAAGYEKHGQILSHLKSEYGVSHGFANLIAARSLSRGQAPTTDDLVEAQYAGRKAPLRPLYDRLIAEVSAFGPDVEIAPKKTSVSLRRHKQFAVIEAPSATRLQLGVNLRGAAPTERLRAAGGMCTHRVDVASAEEIDAGARGMAPRSLRRGVSAQSSTIGRSSRGTKLAASGPNSTTRR